MKKKKKKKKKKKLLQSAVRDLYRRLPACVHASIQHWSSSDFGAKLAQQASEQASKQRRIDLYNCHAGSSTS
jgi:hypothetical protein